LHAVEELPAARGPLTFGALYASEHDAMVRLAFLLTGSTEIAEDVVQDAFVRLHRRWEHIREPRPYLRRAVVNACHSHHRRLRRFRQLPVPAGPVAVELDAHELADALAALPARQRAAIVLRFYADLSEAATADALGCRPGTVGSLVHRGLAQLRRGLEQ
jgi:RNA polymerase sigma-70 factor (sigma-E family)